VVCNFANLRKDYLSTGRIVLETDLFKECDEKYSSATIKRSSPYHAYRYDGSEKVPTYEGSVAAKERKRITDNNKNNATHLKPNIYLVSCVGIFSREQSSWIRRRI